MGRTVELAARPTGRAAARGQQAITCKSAIYGGESTVHGFDPSAVLTGRPRLAVSDIDGDGNACQPVSRGTRIHGNAASMRKRLDSYDEPTHCI
jgi:hypothetical protein